MSQISNKEAFGALAQNTKKNLFFVGRFFREAGKEIKTALENAVVLAKDKDDLMAEAVKEAEKAKEV